MLGIVIFLGCLGFVFDFARIWMKRAGRGRCGARGSVWEFEGKMSFLRWLLGAIHQFVIANAVPLGLKFHVLVD